MKIFLPLVLIVGLLLSGCVAAAPTEPNPGSSASSTIEPPSPTATVPATTTSSSPTQTVPPPQSTAAGPEADSRLATPAGAVVYWGNMNGANLVPLATLTFAVGDTDSIYVTYRANMETASGTVRNEIVSVHNSTWTIKYNEIGPNSSTGDVTLTVSGLPSAITSEPDYPGFDFHISNDAKPGQYSFQIDVAISGRIYPLPVTITVR